MKIKTKKLLILSTLTLLTSVTAATLVACSNDNGSGVTPPSNDQPVKDDPKKDHPVTSHPEDDKQVIIREMPSILDDKLTLNLVPWMKYIKGIENLKALDGEGNETDKLISPEEMLAKYQEVADTLTNDMLRTWDGKAATVKDYGIRSILKKIEKTKFWGMPQIKDEKEIYQAYIGIRNLNGFVFRMIDSYDTVTKTNSSTPTKLWEDSLTNEQTVAFDGDKKSLATFAELFIVPAMSYVYAINIVEFMQQYVYFKIALLNARTSNLSFKDYFKPSDNNKAANAISNMLNAYNKFLNLKEGQYMRSTKEMFIGHGETYYKLLLEINNQEIAPFAKAIGEDSNQPNISGANSQQLDLATTLLTDKFKQPVYTVNNVLEKISKTEQENIDSLITYYKTRFNWMFKTSSEELAANEGNK
ncbi:hypothetical protein [Mycoplasmopsis agassizii]|uniref:Lipoprotein n=1 Tax=Mycoplasmopsis agassizii TaxID=33922 RepID=A0ABX4H4W8_9BACT|nr:hypothetical protein [Mycoplasmopsis agassizii]PAF54823.1 hypothetical protein CJF60_03755 [Mycoplasmopsis agassizii]SMC18662.1 hypothetical protein SAMN02745179_00745 [Mycoplasmopsis agassizii]